MQLPSHLRYTDDHEWVAIDGNRARIGITDYAQSELGSVVYVQLPKVGSTVSAGDAFGEIESSKSVSDVYAPVAGTVVAVNDALGGSPDLTNSDPYGAGWLCEIEMSDAAQVAGLLDAAAYEALVTG